LLILSVEISSLICCFDLNLVNNDASAAGQLDRSVLCDHGEEVLKYFKTMFDRDL
jgi:hypothetical protein